MKLLMYVSYCQVSLPQFKELPCNLVYRYILYIYCLKPEDPKLWGVPPKGACWNVGGHPAGPRPVPTRGGEGAPPSPSPLPPLLWSCPQLHPPLPALHLTLSPALVQLCSRPCTSLSRWPQLCSRSGAKTRMPTGLDARPQLRLRSCLHLWPWPGPSLRPRTPVRGPPPAWLRRGQGGGH